MKMTREQLIEALTELGEECTPNGLNTEGACIGLLVGILGSHAAPVLAELWPDIITQAFARLKLRQIAAQTSRKVHEQRAADLRQARMN